MSESTPEARRAAAVARLSRQGLNSLSAVSNQPVVVGDATMIAPETDAEVGSVSNVAGNSQAVAGVEHRMMTTTNACSPPQWPTSSAMPYGNMGPWMCPAPWQPMMGSPYFGGSAMNPTPVKAPKRSVSVNGKRRRAENVECDPDDPDEEDHDGREGGLYLPPLGAINVTVPPNDYQVCVECAVFEGTFIVKPCGHYPFCLMCLHNGRKVARKKGIRPVCLACSNPVHEYIRAHRVLGTDSLSSVPT